MRDVFNLFVVSICCVLLLTIVSCRDQNAPEEDRNSISCQPKEILFPLKGGEKQVTLSTEKSWTATSNMDWVSVSSSNYGLRGTFSVFVRCDSGNIGEAKIFFSTSTGADTLIIKRVNPKEQVNAIDLGLPSGIKWANMNVGAISPEDYGDYFAWGETEPYYSSLIPLIWKPGKEKGYCWETYCGQELPYWSADQFIELDPAPYDDNKILKPEYDAAYVNLGDNWRMPTSEEIKELINNCTWLLESDYNNTGVKGYIVTSKNNSNSIFFPFAGQCGSTDWPNGGIYSFHVGEYCIYWSASRNNSMRFGAYFLSCDGWGAVCSSNNRAIGSSIRPVCK